jgi:hypothetical protein
VAIRVRLINGAVIFVLAAIVTGSAHADDENRSVGSPLSPAGTPSTLDGKSERSAAPSPPPTLSTDLLRVFVDTATQVRVSSARDLQRRLNKLPADLRSPDAQETARKVASDAQQSILDAFIRENTGREEPTLARPNPIGLWEYWWNVLTRTETALLVSLLSLMTSLVSFLVMRSATRRALRDAGLL